MKKIFVILFLAVGFYFLLDGIQSNYYIEHCFYFDDLDVNQVWEKQYVRGNVDYFLGVKPPKEMVGGIICVEDAITGEASHLACFNEVKNQFGCVIFSSQYEKDFLQSLNSDFVSSNDFFCKVEFNKGWSNYMLDKYYEYFDEDIIYNKNFIFKVVDENRERDKLFHGSILFLSGVIVWVMWLFSYREEYFVSRQDVDYAKKDKVVQENEITKIIKNEWIKKMIMMNKWNRQKRKVFLECIVLMLVIVIYCECHRAVLLCVIAIILAIFFVDLSIFLLLFDNHIFSNYLSRKKGYLNLKKQIDLQEELLNIYYQKRNFIQKEENEEAVSTKVRGDIHG